MGSRREANAGRLRPSPRGRRVRGKPTPRAAEKRCCVRVGTVQRRHAEPDPQRRQRSLSTLSGGRIDGVARRHGWCPIHGSGRREGLEPRSRTLGITRSTSAGSHRTSPSGDEYSCLRPDSRKTPSRACPVCRSRGLTCSFRPRTPYRCSCGVSSGNPSVRLTSEAVTVRVKPVRVAWRGREVARTSVRAVLYVGVVRTSGC